jgi:alanyl-tRNA synthetase
MVSSREIREKYLDFFEKLGHKKIEPSPLVLESDPTTLFTSSGMQQLVPYLKGNPHPQGKKLVDIQPCFRTVDIEEVGDTLHLTFFEMLGNWSLGDYFKKEQLAWCWEFFTEELGIPKERLHVTVFEGTSNVPRDTESVEIWKKIGIPEARIHFYSAEKNWWSRSGTPAQMPAGEIGGPDSEIFYEFDIAHDPKFGPLCHPNCQCGKFLEIGNSVFIQYQKNKKGGLSGLPQKNVDFGGGLERIAAVVDNHSDVFQIDIFKPLIGAIETETSSVYGVDAKKDKSFRIIADHVRAACLISSAGIIPANKLQGYVLRRLIRRAIFHLHLLGSGISGGVLCHLGERLKQDYPGLAENWGAVEKNLSEEGVRFGKALDRGLAVLKKAVEKGVKIDGKFAFNLYQTEGFPFELTAEILKENGQEFTGKEKESFQQEFDEHKEVSRTASAGIFKGGLADASRQVTKLHTATHLLHAVLRKVLGEQVLQKGSNITAERLRFDFSRSEKLTDPEMKTVEALVNEKIKEDLSVSFKEKTLEKAIKEGALAFFAEKYGEKVKVYSIGSFSREICGGPHVAKTSEIGHIKIIKQEKVGAETVRIYAQTA